MICPKCSKDDLIVEDNNTITYYLCIECGYRSNTDLNSKNFDFQPTLIRMTDETKKLIWKDTKTGLYWFPINFDIPKVGVLYPQGSVENIEWVYMPMIEMTDQEKKRYPGKKELPDSVRKKIFNQSNLKEALKLLKILQ